MLIGAGIGAALGGPLGALAGGKLGGACAAGAAAGAALVSLSRRGTWTSATVDEGGGVEETRESGSGGACVNDATTTATTLPPLPPLPTAEGVMPPTPPDAPPQTGGLRSWLGRARAPTSPPPEGALPPLPPLTTVATAGGDRTTSSTLPRLPSLRLATGWLARRGGGSGPPRPPSPPRGQGDAYFKIPPP